MTCLSSSKWAKLPWVGNSHISMSGATPFHHRCCEMWICWWILYHQNLDALCYPPVKTASSYVHWHNTGMWQRDGQKCYSECSMQHWRTLYNLQFIDKRHLYWVTSVTWLTCWGYNIWQTLTLWCCWFMEVCRRMLRNGPTMPGCWNTHSLRRNPLTKIKRMKCCLLWKAICLNLQRTLVSTLMKVLRGLPCRIFDWLPAVHFVAAWWSILTVIKVLAQKHWNFCMILFSIFCSCQVILRCFQTRLVRDAIN